MRILSGTESDSIEIMDTRSILKILVLLSAAAGLTTGEADLRVKPIGDSFMKPLGTSIVFTCEVTGDVNDGVTYNIRWFNRFDAEINEKTGRLYVEEERPSMKKLYITNIEMKDEGRYKCIAEVDGRQEERSVKLNLFKEITFDHVPSPQHPPIHSDALIECRVSGAPEPIISWRYKGERIQFGGRYMSETNGIRIQNITRDDDGEYICRAEVESDGRYRERPISVIVHIPPKISEGPGNLEGTEGHMQTISCKADGLPQPKYEFFKDDSLIPLQSTTQLQVDPDAGRISFWMLNKSDEGKYECRVNNDVGSDKANGFLKVLVKPLIHQFNNVVLSEGQSLTWDCLSHGDPSPNMSLRKAGRDESFVIGQNEDGRIVVNSFAGKIQMSIDAIIPGDMSNFTCRSQSHIGSDEQTALLLVKFRPRFATNHTKSVYIWAGKVRNITCHVQSFPDPVIEWLHLGLPLANNETYRIFIMGRESSLQVRVRESDQGWIYGNYSCRATNELGTNEIKIDLKRASVPSEPQGISVAERMPNSVILDVLPPDENGGEDVVGYRVEYEQIVQDFDAVSISGSMDLGFRPSYNSTHAFDVRGNRIVIDNLKPSTSYLLKVRAKNDVGVGSHITQEVKTESIRKPFPIRVTSQSDGDAFQYTIEWEPPRTGGRPIVEYEFRYRRVRSIEDEQRVEPIEDWRLQKIDDDSNRPITRYILDDLTSDSTYQLEVRVRNDIGWSEVGKQFVFRTRTPTAEEMKSRASVRLGVVVGVVFVIFLLILVSIDVACYFINGCGVTYTICVHACGKKRTYGNEKTMEEGESCKEPKRDEMAATKQGNDIGIEQKLKESVLDGRNENRDENKEEITLQEKEKLMNNRN